MLKMIKAELEDRLDVIIDGGKCKIGIDHSCKSNRWSTNNIKTRIYNRRCIYNVLEKVKLSDNLFKKVNEDT